MRGNLADFLKRVAMAYGLVVLLLFITNAAAIAAWRFPDPDDALRLQEVRDWIGGQGWLDVTQHRIDPLHGGVAMHWSRLVDVPLAAVILALRPLLGAVGAEHAAMLVVPMLTLAVVLVLVARVAWERLGPEASTLSGLMLAMSVPVVTQMRPLRIDHHGWQVAAVVLAMNGLMTRHARIGGWLSGAAMALGMAISLEGLPITAVFGLIGAWRWLRGGETKLWLVHFAQGVAVVSAVAFAATRWGDFAQHCDAVAPVHLAMFAFAALGLSALAHVRQPMAVIAGLGAVGAGAIAIYLGIAPQCRAGSFDMLDPLVRRMWYEGVPEGLPVWKQDWATALQTVIPPLAALGASIALIRRKTGEERVWWEEYALLLAGALAIAVLMTRAGAVAGALAAVPLAWLVAQGLVIAREGRTWDRRLAALVGMVAVLVPAAPITILGMAGWQMPAQAASAMGAGSGMASTSPFLAQGVAQCHVREGAAVLAHLPQGTILAPLDIGPQLLLATSDGVVATGHHRGAVAMRDTLAAFIGTPDAARRLMAAHGARYIAYCPDLLLSQGYTGGDPRSFAGQLLAGHAPVWLDPVPASDGLAVWRMRD